MACLYLLRYDSLFYSSVADAVKNAPKNAVYDITVLPDQYIEILEQLPDGADVIIANKKGNWYQLDDKKWAYHSLIKIVEVKNGRVVDAGFLNIRKGPGTNHSIVKKLQDGALVKIWETDGKWLRIGEGEWGHGAYIEIIE